jgi:hypothetical protein
MTLLAACSGITGALFLPHTTDDALDQLANGTKALRRRWDSVVDRGIVEQSTSFYEPVPWPGSYVQLLFNRHVLVPCSLQFRLVNIPTQLLLLR